MISQVQSSCKGAVKKKWGIGLAQVSAIFPRRSMEQFNALSREPDATRFPNKKMKINRRREANWGLHLGGFWRIPPNF
jgi:hypothetical protein